MKNLAHEKITNPKCHDYFSSGKEADWSHSRAYYGNLLISREPKRESSNFIFGNMNFLCEHLWFGVNRLLCKHSASVWESSFLWCRIHLADELVIFLLCLRLKLLHNFLQMFLYVCFALFYRYIFSRYFVGISSFIIHFLRFIFSNILISSTF